MPSNPAVPSYLTQFIYNFADISRNDLVLTTIDKVRLRQKLSDSDIVIGVTFNWFRLLFSAFLIVNNLPSVVGTLRVGGTKFLAVFLLIMIIK